MKKTTFILFLLSLSTLSMAQDSWKVLCGKKELLKTSVSDESRNIILLSVAELSSKADLVISYSDEDPVKGWSRIIAVFDDKGNELVKKENTLSLSIPLAEVKAMLDKSGKLKIYTWALPDDPELAARIRIRRVYLCTVDMK